MNFEIKKINALLYYKSIIGMEIFLAPFLFIFYNSYCKVSLSNFIFIESIFFITILFLEIPMGYLADVLGRKKSFIVGNFLSASGLFIPIFLPSTLGFIISLFIKSIGSSVASGILSSISYELYKKNEKINDYRKIMSNFAFIALISSSIAALISGFLIKNSIIIPIILDASLTALASLFGFFLIQNQNTNNTQKDIKERFYIQAIDFVETFPLYKKNFFLIINISAIFALTRSSYSFYQPIFLHYKIDSISIAFLFAFFNIISSISAYTSRFVFKNNKIKYFFPIIATLIGISGLFFIVDDIFIIISGIFVQQIYRGMYSSESSFLINSSISDKSKSRVTYLSISSALNLLLTSLFLGLFNYLHNFISFGAVLSIVCFIIFGFITLDILREKLYEQNKLST